MTGRIAVAITFVTLIAVTLVRAQEKPEPKANAAAMTVEIHDVNELLEWARTELGFGFIFDPRHIRDEAGQALEVTYLAPADATKDSGELCLFECLRPLGIVAMDAIGLEGPTYHLLPVHEAAAYGDVTYGLDQLEGLYFGTLALEAQTISVDDLTAVVRRYAGPHAEVTAFEDTSVILVTDFVDHLWAAARAAEEAQIPALREDDTVTDSFAPVHHDAELLRAALDGARQEKEEYSVTLHESSGTLLLTGTRKDVRTARERLEMLESKEVLPTSRVEMHVLDIRSLPVDTAAKALQEYFAEDVRRMLVRIVPVTIKKQILLECSEARYQAALKVLREIDPLPKLMDPNEK